MSETKYRVRDRNDDKKGIKGKVWGENLTYLEAHQLKEAVVGSQKSRTARIEPMPEFVQAPPANDPVIIDARKKATAAAGSAAAEAQRRADEYQKRQKALAAAKAITPVSESDDDDLEDDLPGDIDVDALLEDAVPADETATS